MLLYLIWFLFILLLAISNLLYENIGRSRIAFVGLSLLLILFIGFRGAGYDYLSYEEIYSEIQVYGENDLIEPGFLFICSISPTYQLLLLCVASLTVLFNLTFLYKCSPAFFYSLLLLSTTFLFATFMGQIRQGIALGILAWAVYYFNNKKIFLLLLILAVCFHVSAIVGLLCFLIPHRKCSFQYYVIGIMTAFILGRLTPYAVEFVLQLLPTGSLIGDKLFFYKETEEAILGINTAVLIRLIILFLCYWRLNKIEYSSFPFYLNIYYYSILLYLVLGFVPQMAARGSLYFSYYELILVPFLIMSFSKYNRLIIGGCFILLSVLRFMQFFMDDFNYSEYIPYLKYL